MKISFALIPAFGIALVTTQPAAAQATAAKGPTGLKAVSASRSSVSLSWTTGDSAATRFALERKPLGASWTPPPAPARSPILTTMVEAATAEDKSIEPFTTYVYRVRASGANGALSQPSNEITVGPPPVGFSQILTEPKDLSDPGQFARGMMMTLDANDDPAIAYLFVDPDNNADEADSTLHFIAWNRAQYRWNPPVTVGAIGVNDWDIPGHGLSLAHDAGANLFGLAHMVKNSELHVAFSDDGGVRWRDVMVAKAEENGIGAPSLALDKGRVFLAYNEDGGDSHRYVRFRSGAAADAPEKWTTFTAPILEKTWDARRPGLNVALDGAGKPALLYWLNPAEGYNMTLAFWRPGEKNAVKVIDSADFQSDSTDARLAIKGNEAAVVAYVRRDDDFFKDAHQVWYARSADGGATWSPAAPLPNDGMNSMGPPVTVALDSRGRPAVTAWVDGGNNTGTRCGQPKLIRQAERGAWNICAPENNGTPTKDVRIPRLAFASNDKLYFVFRTRGESPALKTECCFGENDDTSGPGGAHVMLLADVMTLGHNRIHAILRFLSTTCQSNAARP